MGELTRESDPAFAVARVASVERYPRTSIVVGSYGDVVIVTGGGDLVVGRHQPPSTSAHRANLNREQLVELRDAIDHVLALGDG